MALFLRGAPYNSQKGATVAGLRIFETDPDAKRTEEPKATGPRHTFQLRTGMQRNRKPVSLAHWRALAAGEDTAKGIAELLGGSPTHAFPEKEHDYEVLTATPKLEVVLSGADAIVERLTKWNSLGLPEHECDGMYSLLEEDKGEPCGCPPELKQRKELARKGKGPSPNIMVTLRLAGLGYELGEGLWRATSWLFAEDVWKVKAALDEIDGEALCELEIVKVEYERDGELVSFKKPVLTVIGAYADAVAEPR